jgi:uncharacterized membrane protein YtjA (UPF0391 family)
MAADCSNADGPMVGYGRAQSSDGTRFAAKDGGGGIVLQMALVFLVIGIVAALLGFTTIAGASFAIAKFLAGLFFVLFLIFLIAGLAAARRIVS